MLAHELVHDHMSSFCPDVHKTRLQSLIDVATALQKSKNLTLTSMGRNIDSDVALKHKVKKVDRLEGNKTLHSELNELYQGLSDYVFTYIAKSIDTPIIVDLCYIQDSHDIQMLSAEIATKGRTVPLYRDVFERFGLKNRASKFIDNLSACIPSDKKVIIVMDAAFGNDWIKAIEKKNWYWVLRVRRGKKIFLKNSEDWYDVGDFFSEIGERAKNYNDSMIMKRHNVSCRIVTKRLSKNTTRKKPEKLPRNYNSGNGSYSTSAKEPWVLATNLPSEYSASSIINIYKKRMQIEESFRDVKSHQFGLSARYAKTKCVYRWGVKMLLAAIAQIILWVIGVVGHSQNYQKKFQANTVKDRKVFSYFYLGKLIVEHKMVDELNLKRGTLMNIIQAELAREW